MFSEENIERTKERLVEYVKDNAYSFGRKYDKVKGQYSGHWRFNAGDLSVKPIEDAMEVLGTAPAIDIIAETLKDFYGIPNASWYQVVVTDEDEDYYDDYDEDDYGYDDDYDGFYDEDEDDDDTLNQSTNETKDKNELLTGLKDLDDQISILQSMGFLSNAWRDDRDESEVSDNEMVNHPPHYNQGKFETIDIIEDIVAGYDDPVEAYLIGTTLKYLARAPFKNAKKQDLEKAEFYLKRAIDRQQ